MYLDKGNYRKGERERDERHLKVLLMSVAPSELETISMQIVHTTLKFEKDTLLQKVDYFFIFISPSSFPFLALSYYLLICKQIKKIVESFDTSLNELRHEKHLLEAELKCADMKMIVLYKELVLLKVFIYFILLYCLFFYEKYLIFANLK
jgi:hypothetical protein